MGTIARPGDSPPSDRPTHEALLVLGLASFRDVVDRYDEFTPAVRRDVLVAVACFLGDLRQIGAVR